MTHRPRISGYRTMFKKKTEQLRREVVERGKPDPYYPNHSKLKHWTPWGIIDSNRKA